jgi:glycosyltransferase involved in cell wall biosynthesis
LLEIPEVSIILPMRNAENYLDTCIHSILEQTLNNFELIVVDDHSTDNSLDILKEFHDNRFHVVENPGKGLVDALNFGVSLSHSKWIARMDADDIMLPRRLEKLLACLNTYTSIDCISSQVEIFPQDMATQSMQRYIDWQNSCISHDDIINSIYIESPITHPSVIIRKSTLLEVGGYRTGKFPEDYELWLRLFQHGAHFIKLPEVLLRWRQYCDSTFRNHENYSELAFNQVRYDYLLQDRRLTNAHRIFLWGAGPKTRRRLRPLLQSNLAISGWVDIDPKKIDQQYSNIPVYSPEQAILQNPDLNLICVNNHGAREIVAKFLVEHHMKNGMDFLHVG